MNNNYYDKYIKYKTRYTSLKNKMEQRGGEEKSLYERLGGIYNIAMVIDHFSDALINNELVGKKSKNQFLRDWSINNLSRLPGLKWMRTLWVANLSGGPYKFIPTVPGKCPFSLEEAHRKFNISSEEFDEVAKELARSLDFFKVPEKEKQEVLEVFANHKGEVNSGYFVANNMTPPEIKCPFASLH